jgi:antitoxin ParD1/3/4
MNLDLPAETVKAVEALVASGEFQTPQEAIGEGVRLLASRRQLRADIQKGIDELDAGQWVDGKEVFRELRERARTLMEQRGRE